MDDKERQAEDYHNVSSNFVLRVVGVLSSNASNEMQHPVDLEHKKQRGVFACFFRLRDRPIIIIRKRISDTIVL